MLALVCAHITKWMAKKEASFIEITPEMKPLLIKYARLKSIATQFRTEKLVKHSTVYTGY